MSRADPTLRRPRRHLHYDALVGLVRQRFEELPEPRRDPDFSLADTLMAGLALFSLKDPSLLAFMRRAVDHNLRRVFGLRAVPSDTQMRTILDSSSTAESSISRISLDLIHQSGGVAPGAASPPGVDGETCCTVGGKATPTAWNTLPHVPCTSLRSRNRFPSCSTSTICNRSKS
jgi:hypothetical protein